MDTIILAQTAITLATPFLSKIGEGVSRKIGEDIWTLIKKPFQNKGKELNEVEPEKLQAQLEMMLNEDETFRKELEEFVNKNQGSISQQNIQNNAPIEKQVNIKDNFGNLSF